MVSATAVAVYGHPRFRTVGDLVVLVAAAVAIDALAARLVPTRTPLARDLPSADLAAP